MDVENIREFCMSKPEVTESFPFGGDTLVFKVHGKMFALANLDGDLSINLKCDPELVVELRESYPAVQPGYHMNKTHWNTIFMDGSIPDKLIKEWIDHSYWLIVSQLPKITRLKIENSSVNTAYTTNNKK
jgi:predicted DNA-binding protein (MmcQ/YjbR family)